ncbi:MAG: recombinase family protein [Sphingomonadales bacterium]
MMMKIRCAIYTRKSSEDGLEQDFNSLHAQREACVAYIKSQKGEGWVLLPEQYDDGGISGGTLERPALEKLLHDVDQGKVDQIVVYKVDRLTRSLADFAKLVERLDIAGASFVSVTQSFNTATSMGRLTLNVLLSFAQFEREVTAERIRDKIAASKKKGLWMGGHVPLGYDADGRSLKINDAEAQTVRTLYDLYLDLGTVRQVTQAARRRGLRSRRREGKNGTSGGQPFDRGHIHYILTNPLYAGRIRHRDKVHDGQHLAIIDPATWDDVQQRLTTDAARSRGRAGGNSTSVLAGKLFDDTGDRLTPSHANKRGRRYRYYVSRRLIRESGDPAQEGWRLPARPVEQMITKAIATALEERNRIAAMVTDLGAHEVVQVERRVGQLVASLNEQAASVVADLLAKAEIAPGNLTIRLDANAVAAHLSLDPDRLNPDALAIVAPFRMRRRGVETRIILGNETPEVDPVLLRNLAKAHRWYEEIKRGRTFDEIAANHGTSKRRIQQMIDLAFLAPDIVLMIVEGRQPAALNTDWFEGRNLPPDWEAQRRLIAAL